MYRPSTLALATLALAATAGCRTAPAEGEGARPDPAGAAAVARAAAAVPAPTAPTAAAAAGGSLAAAAQPTPRTLKLGQPITSARTTSLADIARRPADFKGKTVATSGTVKAVCQEQGCWMEIVDQAADANVRMHGHAFFIPKTSAGKQARVEGTVMLVKDGAECDEMSATGATLQLDATGVELM